jgi:hypothetical protein
VVNDVAIYALFSGIWIASPAFAGAGSSLAMIGTDQTFLVFLSISYLRSILFSHFWYCSDPVGESALISVQSELTLVSYGDSVVFYIFLDDEEGGSSSDFDPFSLTDRV